MPQKTYKAYVAKSTVVTTGMCVFVIQHTLA
jgi:hypothetical protein